MAKATPPQPQPSGAALHSFPAQIYSLPATMPLQSSNMPQLIFSPNALPQHFLSSGYALQQSPIVEPLPSQAYAVSSSAASAPPQALHSFRQDSHILNPAAPPALSSLPSFPPSHSRLQMPMASEPLAAVLSPDPSPWARHEMDAEWHDEMPGSSVLRPNAAESPWQNPRFGVGENGCRDSYPRYHGRPSPAGREEAVRSSEFRHGRGRSDAGPRGEQGWSHKQGWSRQRRGHRDQHRSSGGKWRDRDRDRDRR